MNDQTAARALSEDAKYLRSFHDEAKWWPIADRIDALVDENDRLAEEIERRAAESARLQDGVIQMVNALWSLYEQGQSVARKPRMQAEGAEPARTAIARLPRNEYKHPGWLSTGDKIASAVVLFIFLLLSGAIWGCILFLVWRFTGWTP